MTVPPTRERALEPVAREDRAGSAAPPAHPPLIAQVLSLQQEAGNAAVSRLLDDAPSAPAPDGGSLAAAAEVAEPNRPAGEPGEVDEASVDGSSAGPDTRAPGAPAANAAGRPAETGAAAGATRAPVAPAAGGEPAPGPDAQAEEPGAAPAAGAAARPSTRDPHQDPAFEAMKQQVTGAAAGQKAHPPAKAGAAAAQAAAVPPDNEVASQAAGAQVEEMGEKKPGTFDRAAFIAAVQKAVDASAPKNLSEASNFGESGKAARIKGQVAGLVKGGKAESERDIRQATEAPPDPSRATPKTVTPLAPQRPGAAPTGVDAAAAMPAPRPEAEIDLSAGPARVDATMADAELTEEQLAESNEPDFTAVLQARRAAREHAEIAPATYRAHEQDVLAGAADDAGTTAEEGLGDMRATKVSALAKVVGQQRESKSADEGRRAKVATAVQDIYTRTKSDVTRMLQELDPKVDKEFGKGEEAARTQFESYVGEQMRAYKKKRYKGWRGKARWVRDKFAGLPSAVNAFYESGRSAYLKSMEAVIGRVTDLVGAELEAVRTRIAAGRAEVRKYVTGLPKELRDVGKEAETKLDSQFEELSTDVDAKQDELVEALAQKYISARDALDSRIEDLEAENRGLVEKAVDFAVGVAKTVWKLKDMLLSVLAKAASVVTDIVAHPIRFLENLVSGIGTGLRKFKDNIVGHLEDAFSKWLFGALGNAGIKAPESLDFAGILDLATQILGLTYEHVRARVVKHTSEEAVAGMEQKVEVFKTLKAKGMAGIWEWVKEKVSNLESLVLGKIKDFVIDRVVKGGIAWILSLLTPASAFIKACKAIYDIIMFVVERAAQIKEFIDSVLDSIGDIARGNVAGAAAKVEGALANALPLAISFLASLLNLGGISDRIQSIVNAVRAPIQKAIDAIVMGGVKLYKRTFGRAIGWAKGKAASVRDRLTGRGKGEAAAPPTEAPAPGLEAPGEEQPVTFDAEGDHHSLWVDPAARPPQVYVASAVPKRMHDLLDHWAERVDTLPEAQRAGARRDLAEANAVVDREEAQRRAGQARTKAEAQARGRKLVPSSTTVSIIEAQSGPDPDLVRLAPLMARLFECFRYDDAPAEEEERAASFRCVARITLARQPASGPATREEMPTSRARSGGVAYRPPSVGAAATDGAMPPPSGRTTVQTRTWATGDTRPGETNTSHGERHMAAWLDSEAEQDPDFLRSIVKIELENDPFSPCAACTDVLVGMLRGLPNVRVATLTWSRPYYPARGRAGPNATRVSNLNELIRAGWAIHPGPGEFARMAAELEQRPRGRG